MISAPPTPLSDIYRQPPVPVREYKGVINGDRTIDRVAAWRKFAETGRENLAATNSLTMEENDELLHTPVIDRMIELVLIGLSRLGPYRARRA